jgi:hypothetical protein
MYGLQAINAANGWVIALAGLGIVFTGLVILAILIAQTERFLKLWDRMCEEILKHRPGLLSSEPEILTPPPRGKPPAPETDRTEIHLSHEESEILSNFQLITQRMGEPFPLHSLLEKAEKLGVPNPQSYLNTFLKWGLIVESREKDQKGLYQWREDLKVPLEEDYTF